MALEKLDAQAVKQRAKWRATHRRNGPSERARTKPAEIAPEAPRSPSRGQRLESSRADWKRVFRVNGVGRRKPMTLDEALLEMDTESRLPGVS